MTSFVSLELRSLITGIVIFLFRNFLALAALAEWNMTTVLFPESAGIVCVFFVVMVKIRKTKLDIIS